MEEQKTSFPADAGQADAATKAVVCAVLMPHAPVLVPAIGGGRVGPVAASCEAMRAAAQKVMSAQPDTLVLVSPHSPRKSGAFGLWADDPIAGSFEPFGAPLVRVSLPNDRRMIGAIGAEARARNVEIWAIRHHALDHGALVPLWFLMEAGWRGPTVIASLNYPEEGGLTSFGEAIAAAGKSLQRRVAFIASGDMSHRLTADAPCGFHPQAHRFDEAFIRQIRAGDYRSLHNLDHKLRDLAAEDAVDSTEVAAAAVDWNAAGHRVLNYEGPYGVGYGVAVLFAPEPEPRSNMKTLRAGEVLPAIARLSVQAALQGASETAPEASGEYLKTPRGVFVTIHRRHGELRGCIGTVTPACANVVAETWRNARLAALHDGRFSPVTAQELPQLQFEVSVLHPPEEIFSPADLDPQHYGVIVSAADGRRGLLLPGISNITNVGQQLFFARRKGRIDPEEPVRIERFEVDRFEET